MTGAYSNSVLILILYAPLLALSSKYWTMMRFHSPSRNYPLQWNEYWQDQSIMSQLELLSANSLGYVYPSARTPSARKGFWFLETRQKRTWFTINSGCSAGHRPHPLFRLWITPCDHPIIPRNAPLLVTMFSTRFVLFATVALVAMKDIQASALPQDGDTGVVGVSISCIEPRASN
jgi:hypothetical protein